MRKFILVITGIFLCNILFGQAKSKEYFMERSKKQKKTAWILLGIGAAAIATEAIADNSQKGTGQSLTGGVMTLGGVISTLASIPFFIGSTKNRKRATSLSIMNQRLPQLLGNAKASRNLPSISFNVSL